MITATINIKVGIKFIISAAEPANGIGLSHLVPFYEICFFFASRFPMKK